MIDYCGDVLLPVTISLGVAVRQSTTVSLDEMVK
jgi:hypothetical protein